MTASGPSRPYTNASELTGNSETLSLVIATMRPLGQDLRNSFASFRRTSLFKSDTGARLRNDRFGLVSVQKLGEVFGGTHSK
jgi:hypothetical protein